MTTEIDQRWTLLYGIYRGVERTATTELQRGVQFYLPYVLTIQSADGTDLATMQHLLLVGTVDSNPAVAQLLEYIGCTAPPQSGSFLLHVGPSPWSKVARVIAVVGADAVGTLHGVAELLAQISLGGLPHDIATYRRLRIDGLPDMTETFVPAITQRGLWTWGYVIYDYRRYLDNMVRLKLNTLTIWNDCVPVNMAEILEYAHDRGIAVHAGFHWGWGIPDLDISKAEDRNKICESVLRTWREQYAALPIDGLYFQTITEHTTTEIAGRSVAAWCCELINPIAHELWKLRPDLPIQFGLHATSIKEHFTDLDALDPRLTITWEDAGALPFSDIPQPDNWGHGIPHNFEATLDYAKRLAQWRPGMPFAMVPKGWIMLRWGVEFEHHGPFICGERRPEYIRERLQARQGEWDWQNQLWYQNYPLAARFYRELLINSPHGILATGLVEDGMFEEKIQPSVALFAETLWNPLQADNDILSRSLRPYVQGV
jgi:hypothetical protein